MDEKCFTHFVALIQDRELCVYKLFRGSTPEECSKKADRWNAIRKKIKTGALFSPEENKTNGWIYVCEVNLNDNS